METEEQKQVQFEPLASAVEQILTQYHDSATAIENSILLTDPGRRNQIWRCKTQSTENHVPATVVVKQVQQDGYDLTNPEAWDTFRLFKDWAGAQFLTEIAGDDGHGPAFYGGNIEHGFIVIEDMGEHTSLVQPLLGSDAPTAGNALIAYAIRLGRMHASTMGKEGQYREIQRLISPAWLELELKPIDDPLQSQTQRIVEYAEHCMRLGVEPHEQAMQEFGSLVQRLADPGPFKTFIHCDPCPDNVFYKAPQLRLIDFEFSGFGPALQDGLYGRLPFPTCWCANAVPSEIIRKMEDAYRSELASVCPDILDDERFRQEACAVASSWAFTGMQWSVSGLVEHDEEWGIASNRARVLTRIRVFLDSALSIDKYPALVDAYMKVLAQLQRRWPEAAPLPVYPAFRGE